MFEHQIKQFWILARIREYIQHHHKEIGMKIQKIELSHHYHVCSILE